MKTQKDRNDLLQRIANARKEEAKVKYLDSATLAKHMEAYHDGLFRDIATEHDRHCCKEIARGFTYVIPFVDRYVEVMKQIKITEDVLRRRYTPATWDALPETNRNQIRKAAHRYNKAVEKAVNDLQAFVNRQAGHLNEMPDETAEILLEDIV